MALRQSNVPMPDSRITASDVARKAGVSQPTVSRVFTPGARVSPDRERRVREAARELGYQPNTLARSLNTGRSYTIGVVLACLQNPFYPEALQRLSEALSAKGYHVMVFFAANMAEEVDGVVDNLLAHQVDGIILASVSISNELTDRLKELKIPFVLFNRAQEDRGLPAVTAANFEGGKRAGRFLAAGGHVRIAHIAGWQKSLNGRDRQAGFVAGLAEHGLAPFRIIYGEYDRQKAIAATRALFDCGTFPDAVFVGNDHMAFAVLETLRMDLGLRVPDDVSVVGYDDVPMAAWGTYDLTTLRQPVNRMVGETVSMLLAMINNHPLQGRVEIDSPLILRGSARIPDGWTSPRRIRHPRNTTG
ncbi:LacI family DNA-binding transcriptional regulator [Ovoidimarina sediminis]|uniref:LacI family DNA-binding transcriptional regulator n=1 Tax=Ovoidimarina sediminis TaxID=3079856 RepID=UPI002907412A|nr:LacI family DNA-binding transcriptional regulator [Rhodophyticola sp. MJ-SS7]MDU8946398.1 LacI family DNA-binding transcriptional regulator [Rhodophyticola sp. MJ-SS7]